MLRTLSIRNFALVDSLELDFGAGLNLLTGETGSGKSVLVGAIELLLGGRAWQELIRSGRESARVEGLFELRQGHPGYSMLEAAGIASEGTEIVVRREISSSGKNKIFINSSLATLQLLGQLGELLVDLHGQHDQQLLLRPRHHLQWLDHFADLGSLVEEVRLRCARWSQLRRELEQLRSDEQQRLQRIDTLRYQVADISQTKLAPGREDELLAERHLLAHAERRAESSGSSYERLYEGDGSVLASLAQLERTMSQLAEIDPKATPHVERLLETRYALEDVAYFLRDYRQSIDFNPDRLAALENELEEIARLKKKYGATVAGVLAYLASIQSELEILQQSGRREAELEVEVGESRRLFDELAARLSAARRRHARQLEKRMEGELGQLAMEKTRFGVQFESCEAQPSGTDRVEFLVSPNPGEDLKPLARIASGGELSRVILALKSLISLDDPDKALVFDEVDVGIGGRVAETLGRKLRRLAATQQVLCVTHLPQIASFADRHFLVTKQSSARRTAVDVQLLDGRERVEEIARMLGGATITETTRRHAAEMLEAAKT